MLKFIDVFRKYFSKISYTLSATILLFMTCLQFFQIFYRYIFGSVFIWSSDIIIFSITTSIALAIPPLWLEHADVTMDLITEKLSSKANFILSCLVDLICIFMAAIIAYAGIVAVIMHRGYSTSILRYDDSLDYVFVIYIGVMLFIVAILSLIERIMKFKKGGTTGDY